MALQELGVGREEADLGRHKSHLTHAALKGKTPIETMESKGANLKSYGWLPHRRGWYQTSIAARALIRHGQDQRQGEGMVERLLM